MLFMPLILHASSVKEIINLPVTFFDHENTIKTVITAYEFPANAVDDKKVIVIDAGHGGHDPGAMGKYSKEKDIALEIALKLGAMISEHHTFDVRYTRKNDVFIPLHKRIGQANDYKADLFISIHCNYVDNPHVCGTETFVMGLHKAEENLQVAKRENSAILMESEFESVYEGYDPNSPIGHILLSMFQNIHLDNSITLASHIEGKLNNRNKTKSRGVKQAGFVVLKRATMPSILVETGFLSNPKEEQYLMSTNGQEEMAMAISIGVLMYLDA